jgi:RND family efflux transporter MFP subunit
MIVFLTLCYIPLLYGLIRLRLVPNTGLAWASTLVWMLLLFVFLFIPLQWAAPAGPARLLTYSVPIVPNVAGTVTEVMAKPNMPMKKSDPLFQIDPVPYRAAVDALSAQLRFQQLRLSQFERLGEGPAGSRFQIEETAATIERLEAELTAARYNLSQTTVTAPADGFATYLALRPGQRVGALPFAPVMSFVETGRRDAIVSIQQIHVRHLRQGQPVELAFKTRPGQIITGEVLSVLQVNAAGQENATGQVPVAAPVRAEPFIVRVRLDNPELANALPAGSVGTAAIYSGQLAATHVIRRVMLRMEGFLNYIWPAL